MGPATSGGMSPCRCGRIWMASSRVRSASSEGNPKVRARAMFPGIGGMSRSASKGAGARASAAARSAPAAAMASANPRAAAVPRSAVDTGRLYQAPDRLPKKKAGMIPPGTIPALLAEKELLQVHVVLVVRRLARRVVRVGRAVRAAGEHARLARDRPLVNQRVGVDVAARQRRGPP